MPTPLTSTDFSNRHDSAETPQDEGPGMRSPAAAPRLRAVIGALAAPGALMVLAACSSKRIHQYDARSTHARQECPELHDGLSGISPDPDYGYQPEKAVRVGGGPGNEMLYLQMLLGPEGQYLQSYYKDGSRVGPDGTTRLNLWRIVVDGDTLQNPLFTDMVHCADPKAPQGFRVKEEFQEKAGL